jgi:hypothetical protein
MDWAGKKPTADEWRDILEKHAKWLRSKSDGERANLSFADLSSANLRYADLHSANLRYADLSSADLSSADLSSANLRYADLRYADLRYADLHSANLRYAKNSELAVAMTRIVPEGDLIGWKKCRNGVLVQLLIPLAARRSHAFGRICRAEAAVVMAIEPKGAKAESKHAMGFFYEQGAVIRPDKWEEDWTVECGGGIHFFITKAEAQAWEG